MPLDQRPAATAVRAGMQGFVCGHCSGQYSVVMRSVAQSVVLRLSVAARPPE
jgi:hypothetical protein